MFWCRVRGKRKGGEGLEWFGGVVGELGLGIIISWG